MGEDIGAQADTIVHTYVKTHGGHMCVSLVVSPTLEWLIVNTIIT